jgi:hypothetical protein
MARTPFSSLDRSFVIEVYIGHFAPVERNTVKHPRIDDRARAFDCVSESCDEHAAFAAKHELRSFLCEAIVPNLGRITDLERDLACRVRSADYAVTAAEGTAVVPQRPMAGIHVGSKSDFEDSAVASTSIFLHVMPPLFAWRSQSWTPIAAVSVLSLELDPHEANRTSMTSPTPTIIVRRRWDDRQSARVAADHLRELAIKNQPGGICGPIPRPFLFARVWCDHLIDGADIHTCDPRSAPHELELCVLERDNADLYATLRARLRR